MTKGLFVQAIAPFEIAIVPMNAHKSPRTLEAAEALYAELQAQGFDVLLDDRNERPGVKFSDLELMGIPHRIVIGEKVLMRVLLNIKVAVMLKRAI